MVGGGSLSGRLARLRALRAAREASHPVPETQNGPSDILPFSPAADPSRDAGPTCTVHGESRQFDVLLERNGWTRIGEYTWKKSTFLDLDMPRSLRSLLLYGEEVECGRLVFFDTETTGLSGGAGNHVFLFGAGTAADGGQDGFRIDQYFLSDFPGEPEFLSAFSPVFSDPSVLVSYNGRNFDCNILSTRFLMNGLRIAFGRHIDLLYPSRMLWKTLLPSCSLSSVEQAVLSVSRVDDVPGSAVPDIYFSFLKTGNPAMLFKVFEHNLTDISSLLRLLLHLENLFADPSPDAFADLHRLARFLLTRNEPGGVRLLQSCWAGGDAFSGNLLGTHYRRERNYAEAERIWKDVFASNGSIFAGIELAKLYEHRLKDPGAALSVTDAVLSRPKLFWTASGDDLFRRRARLMRKMRAAVLPHHVNHPEADGTPGQAVFPETGIQDNPEDPSCSPDEVNPGE